MWEEWRCVGEVEVFDRGGEVWWEGWRCVGGVEVSIEGVESVGRSEVCRRVEMCGKE